MAEEDAQSTERKRGKKRKWLDVPEPTTPDRKIKTIISTVKCTLNKIVRDPLAKEALEKVVFVVNQHRKRVAMFAKELLLTKLHANEPLPKLNSDFFSACATALRNGTWSKSRQHIGHEDLLQRHRAPPNEISTVLLTQAMALAAKATAAQLKTHYKMHYENFVRRWKKLPQDDRGGLTEEELKTDPDETKLHVLITHAWKIRRCLETATLTRKGFALFPEAKAEMSFVTLDNTCITQLFKQLYPDDPLLFYMGVRKKGKHKGQPRKYTYPHNDLAFNQHKAIWDRLFYMKRIRRLRRNHDFRFSLQTDGYAVCLNFQRYHEYDAGPKRRKTMQAKHMAVQDMVPGRDYTFQNKTLRSLEDLTRWTLRSVDPNVHRTYQSVDLGTGEDVRKSKMQMRGDAWRKRIKSKEFGAKQAQWREEALLEEQKALNAAPYCTSSFPDRYAKYVNATYACWKEVWSFVKERKRRKLRFRAGCIYMRELDREVDKLCKHREGDTRTLLIFGNGARTNLFGRVKSGIRGPAKKLHDRAVQRKKAVVVWAEEFRTSKYGPNGHVLKHPLEKDPKKCKTPRCKTQEHGLEVRGCRCYCSFKEGCTKKRTVKSWCDEHKKPVRKYDVCYQIQGQPKHRMWNRDVVAAVNIGCLFLAHAMGLDVGPWTRGRKPIVHKSWLRVFHGTPPYSIAKVRSAKSI